LQKRSGISQELETPGAAFQPRVNPWFGSGLPAVAW